MSNSKEIKSLRPICRRTFASFQHYLKEGEAAFYLGAGVDRQIATDSLDCAGLTYSPDWLELLCRLGPYDEIKGMARNVASDSDESRELIKKWQTESASWSLWTLGEQEFRARINLAVNADFDIKVDKNFTEVLCRALTKSNLIVTPNYSSYIYKALIEYIKTRPKLAKMKIIVLDREDLASFDFPPPQKNPKQIFLIHIHGRPSPRSFPVLDTWGYNLAINDDRHYRVFFENLFSQRNVFSIGTSWEDLPLKNAAAFVYRTQSYLRRSHLAFVFEAEKKPSLAGSTQETHRISPKRKWTNAMSAVYGLNVIFVQHESQPKLLRQLTGKSAYPSPEDLRRVADFLDHSGDYESSLQDTWLLHVAESYFPIAKERSSSGKTTNKRNKEESPANKVSRVAKHLYQILLARLRLRKIPWDVAARIERHLRHHLFLYPGPTKFELIREQRRTLWERLASMAPPTNSSEWKKLDIQLRFDFLVGQYELGVQPNNEVNHYQINDQPFKNRFDKGAQIWQFRDRKNLRVDKARILRGTLSDIEKMAIKLLDDGWEAMAAKAILDKVHLLAEVLAKHNHKPQDEDSYNKYRQQIVDDAVRAEAIARSAGCYRRLMKAEVLRAIWDDKPHEGRLRILGRLRSTEASGTLEPVMFAGFAVGLFVCHMGSLKLRNDKSLGSLDGVTSLFEEAGIKLDAGYKNYFAYWKRLVPRREGEYLEKYLVKLGWENHVSHRS